MDLDMRRLRAVARSRWRSMPASAGHDLDDLTQIAALAALEATPRFVDPDGGATLGGWQRAHARWALQREADSQSWPSTVVLHELPEDFDAIDEGAPSVEDIVDQRMQLQAVARAAERLKERERRLLRHVYVDDMTVTEVASVEGVHRSNVTRELARVMRRLRKFLWMAGAR